MHSYIGFLAAELYAEISGMNAENMQRQVLSQSMAYTEEQYFNVLQGYREKLKQYEENMMRASSR
mgnify:CR=1 FL=1